MAIKVAVAGRKDSVVVPKGTTIKEVLNRAEVKADLKDVSRFLTARLEEQRKKVDLNYALEKDEKITPLPFDDPAGREDFWHSTAHLMAQAVKELYPEAQLTIGPPVEDGFYYDIDHPTPFTESDLPKIEERMREIVKRDLPIRRREVSRDEARKLFESRGERYKLELLDGITDATVSLYEQGEFVDLCRGPHVPSTGYLKAVKLTSVAGAYWRGDERNRQLMRLYGVSFPTEEALQAHMKMLEEAERRDHRKLGRELDLILYPEEAGPGMVFFPPKGAVIREALNEFSKAEHVKRGYQLVWTPQLLRKDLWRISGHLDHYVENMYFLRTTDQQDYVIKPMNCPGHILIYQSAGRSYRELPIRYYELGTVYRQERSGTLHGMLRGRVLSIDDAHIFCMPDQLHEELSNVVAFVEEVLTMFGFSYTAILSTRGDKEVIGSFEMWERATDALSGALTARNLPFLVEAGEAAFYGPKIDFKIKDAIGRIWQCSTIQLDFNLPQRFGMEYTGADGAKHTPVMIHRAIFGSLERFFGILIEHYAGEFPVWLAPVQAVVLTITSDQEPFARQVVERLRVAGVRAEGDWGSDKIGYKIRSAELKKIPYMLVIGKREAAAGQVAVRVKGKGDEGAVSLEAFLERITMEISQRKL